MLRPVTTAQGRTKKLFHTFGIQIQNVKKHLEIFILRAKFIDVSIIDGDMKDLVLDDVYLYLLERTVRQFRKYSQQEFARHGIDMSGEQWIVLKRIGEQEGLKQRDVAELTYKDPASVTRILDILEKKKLIQRMPVENDRRTYALFLTEQGRLLIEKLTPLAVEIRNKGTEGLSEKELRQLKQMLNKVYENFS